MVSKATCTDGGLKIMKVTQHGIDKFGQERSRHDLADLVVSPPSYR